MVCLTIYVDLKCHLVELTSRLVKQIAPMANNCDLKSHLTDVAKPILWKKHLFVYRTEYSFDKGPFIKTIKGNANKK